MQQLSAENIKQRIFQTVAGLVEDETVVVTERTPLIGDGRALDSMKLVELCLALEDLAGELGSAFDWTSETAMSRSRSMFRSAGSLATEFLAQRDGRE